jgi:4-diphosphocytidyl-2-C-methyl-D-erythritol kinase
MYLFRLGPSVHVHAPAKVNLFFDVLRRRPDGYHDVNTLMSAVTLFDTLTLSPQPDEHVRVECRWALGYRARRVGTDGSAALPAERDNIVWRALELFRQRAAIESGVLARLVKRIPVEAGLGGASSDAAAALVAANEMWQTGWSGARLSELAAELGSDVPFFLAGDSAICTGRGERVEPAPTAKLHFVLVKPPFGMPTANVYRACQPAGKEASDITPMLQAARRGDVANVARNLMNRLRPTAENLQPRLGEIRRRMSQVGGCGSEMSGSGSACFAVCRHARHARRTAARLAAQKLGTTWCVATARVPDGGGAI